MGAAKAAAQGIEAEYVLTGAACQNVLERIARSGRGEPKVRWGRMRPNSGLKGQITDSRRYSLQDKW
jgi:hypothetical protein